jgi:hypothetical protein
METNASSGRTKSLGLYHRLSIDRPTKRGKEKSPSDGHCQCEKETDGYLLACQQSFEKEPQSDTLLKSEHQF